MKGFRGTVDAVATGQAEAIRTLSAGTGAGGGGCAGAACGGACFVAGTLVDTPAGLVPIETVHAGDLVLSRSEDTGEWSVQPVVRAFVRQAPSLVDVTLERRPGRERAARATVRSTPEHPYWTLDRGWVRAGELAVGEEATDESGAALAVVALREIPDAAPVYNVEVATTHTYFVGPLHAWVHNAKCGPGFEGEQASTYGHPEPVIVASASAAPPPPTFPVSNPTAERIVEIQAIIAHTSQSTRDKYNEPIEKAQTELAVAQSKLAAVDARIAAGGIDGLKARRERSKLKKDFDDKTWKVRGEEQWRDSRMEREIRNDNKYWQQKLDELRSAPGRGPSDPMTHDPGAPRDQPLPGYDPATAPSGFVPPTDAPPPHYGTLPPRYTP